MKPGQIAVFAVVVVIVVIVNLFTVSDDTIIAFNDATIDALDEVDGAIADYVIALTSYLEGKAADLPLLKEEFKDLKIALSKTDAKVQAIEIPDKEVCRTFIAAARAQVVHCQAMTEVLKESIAYVATHPESTEENAQHIIDLIEPEMEKYDALATRIDGAQATMAREYGLEVIDQE